MEDPIIVTGAARSGTSLVAGIVHKCGAWGGDMFGPSQFNQRGYFENKRIREEVVKPYLRSVGFDPMGQDPLPEETPDYHMDSGFGTSLLLPRFSFRPPIVEIIREQGHRSDPWFYKCAKSCFLWPLFFEAFPNAKWVIVRRDTDRIVDSCLRTSFMRAFRDRAGWTGWVEYHLRRFEEMRAAPIQTWEVWSEKIVDGDVSEVYDVIQAVGLRWNEQAVSDFIAPELYHGS